MSEGSHRTDLTVECYAGHRGEQTPRRLRWYGRSVEVVEILDQWLAPDHRYFKVRLEDGSVMILRHDTSSHLWDWTFFRRGEES